MVPVETLPGMGREDERDKWRGWIQVWYIWYTVRTFANIPLTPTQHNNHKKMWRVIVRGVGYMMRVNEGEYGCCIFYICMNMEHWNLSKSFNVSGRKGKIMEGMNQIVKHYMYTQKCHIKPCVIIIH
jgi:hypothetical protein